MHFFSLISNFSKQFKKKRYSTAHIVTHHDTDGICAAAILIRLLRLRKIKYRTTVVPNLDKKIIKRIAKNNADLFFFVDIGTSFVKDISSQIKKDTIILDHHYAKKVYSKVKIINPYFSSKYEEISGAGVVYLFASDLEPELKKYAYLAIIGAIGDCQDKQIEGLRELNRTILKQAYPSIKESKNSFILNIDDNLPKDAHEFSTLINSCGRQGYGRIGIKTCLLEPKAILKAKELSYDYRKKLRDALSWYKSNTHKKGKEFIIINAQKNISPTLIGTLTSMLARSEKHHKGKVIIGLAEEKNNIKVSARYIGKKEIDMRILMEKVMFSFKGSYGGHKNAAGAVLKKTDKKRFIMEVSSLLKQEL